MSQDPQPSLESPASAAPRLLVELDPWPQVFLRNFRDLFRPQPFIHTSSSPAPFWPDVFVKTGFPGRGLAQSGLWHVFALLALYGAGMAWFPPPLRPSDVFKNHSITYYSVSEYLPKLDSGSEPAPQPRKGQPAFARQKVISLPKSPDNSRQTIIDPSSVRLLRDYKAMPNLVAWTPVPVPVPVSGATRSASQITLPKVDMSVIAPPPQDVKRDVAQMKLTNPAPAAVEPTAQSSRRDIAKLNLPSVPTGAVEPIASADAAQRKIGELDIAHAEPGAAAPKLPAVEQRSVGTVSADGAAAGTSTAQSGASVPPAPSAAGAGNVGQAAGRLIALGLDPAAAKGPIELPGGNRHGVFAAGPEGKPGAPGTPDIAGGGAGPGGRGSGDVGGAGKGGAGDIPSGITVAGGPASTLAAVVAAPAAAAPSPPPAVQRPAPVRPNLFAASIPKSVADIARQTGPARPEGKVEDQVFGPKKYYTMALNMPNLTSAGGSWIIRFAELNEGNVKGELTAPVAMLKVDPAYPAELIRDQVEGTVMLYAVIHADGSVADVRVLRGVDDRLDENARAALLRWHFRPGTKNGNAVDLEAVVQIPFRARKIQF